MAACNHATKKITRKNIKANITKEFIPGRLT